MNPLRAPPILALVLPCFNEAEGLPEVVREVEARLADWTREGLIQAGSFACFVDDGSIDGTWEIIATHVARTPSLRGLKLSRNFGHQAAVLAGLLHAGADADAVITIDADLQQDIAAVEAFVARYREGADVVFGVRRDRNTDGHLKRWTAEAFYWAMRRAGVKVVRNHADYRLLSSKVVRALGQYEESNLFLRGLVHELGFRTAEVLFDVRARRAGCSKYDARKMLSLALDGVTSFSAFPLRMVAVLGVLLMLVSFGMIAYVVAMRLWFEETVPGWASTVVPIYFIGGVQLFCLGVVGEYVGRVYIETKRRPRFLIDAETPARDAGAQPRPAVPAEPGVAPGRRAKHG